MTTNNDGPQGDSAEDIDRVIAELDDRRADVQATLAELDAERQQLVADRPKHPWAGVCTCTPLTNGNLRRNPTCPLHANFAADERGVIDRRAAGGDDPPGWRKSL